MNASVSSSQFSISRYTIRNPEEADKPRSRRELNATRALGAILNKPQWWVKWTTRPDVRTKWLREIDEQLIRLNVSQTIRGWPSKRYGRFHMVYTLAEAANSRFEDIPRLAEQILQNIPYHRPVEDSGAYSVGLAYETDDEMDEFGRDVKGAHAEDGEDNSAEVFHEFDDDEDESAYGYDSDYDDGRFYSGFSVRHSSSEVYEHHKKSLNSFCEIGWYVTMAIAREKLRDLPLAEWTDTNVTAMIGVHENEDEQINRTTELMLAVVLDPRPVSLDVLRGHLPDESRDEVLKLLLLHFQRVIAILDATKKDIATVLDLIIQRAHLADSSLAQHNTPGTVPQTWLSDDAIPVELKRKFVAEVASLENVPDEQKDWHPHSDNQVLDLVHPSLFCGRINKNMIRRPSSWMAPAVSAVGSHETSTVAEIPLTGTAAEHMNSILFAPTTGLLQGHWSTQFQWLPSEFEVAEDGRSVNIRTYINNLHPEIHASMYDSIGSIFSRFVPLFDQVISSLDDARIQKKLDDSSVWDRIYRDKSTPVHPANATVIENLTRELGAPPTSSLRRLAPPGLFEIDSPRFSLKGNRCQVIVKIAEIHLTPDKPNYNGGSWHIEGTDAERIIATGLYYFGCENITESRLSFRMFVGMPDYDQNDDVGVALSYELYEDHSMVQSLGSVTAMEDRCVVFPNTYQHKVEPFSLADPSKPGVRKILAFFLVDPVNDPIPSTAIVPPQQQEWIDLAREPQLMSMGLPDVVTDRIREMTRTGMSLEEAKSLRLGLMAERKVANVDQDEYYTLSLCEH